jgi:hypothetical protein
MNRALALRAACAILGASFSLLACSGGSNPTVPPGFQPLDGGLDQRGISHPVDAPPVFSEAGVEDVAGKGDVLDASARGDSAVADAAPKAKVTVTIQVPAAPTDADGGVAAPIVISKKDRLAPVVRVDVESLGTDLTGDAIAGVTASLLTTDGKATSVASAQLGQTQLTVLPESTAKSYVYSDTPLDLSKVSGAFYDLQVVATTLSGVTGKATLRLFIDAGPSITFLQPADGAYVKTSVVVTAIITDSDADVASVTFAVGQTPLPPSAIEAKGVQYTATITAASFDPPLDGAQLLTVTATNSNGNVSIGTRKFTVDTNGPTISNTKPATGDLIGKIITIEASVSDPAGVMDSSVVAVVAHGDVHFEVNLTKGSDGVYRHIFDTTQLPEYAIFPTISFRAQDVLGNESAVGSLVSLDNTPPILDLDPPDQFRLYTKDGTCSWPFDPVGPDAIDDGSVVNQLFDIRARIEDEGNTPQSGSADFVPIATVDPASVKVLILDDSSLPLVVDTSDPPDGICDDINPNIAPSVSPQSSKEAQLLNMVPMPANTGAGDFTPEPGSSCSGNASSPPNTLCATTYSPLKQASMTYSLGYSSGLPAIWTLAPIINDKLQCAGRQFDSANNLKDGWACVAVVAADKLGNKQVSRPIRICVEALPGSTACSAAGMGGADITSITFPASSLDHLVFTTAAPLLGKGGQPLVDNDTVILSKVSPAPYSVINGTHTISPAVGGTGASFTITDVMVVPYTLYLDNLDDKPPVLKGPVTVIAQAGKDVQIVTDATTALDPTFAGAVVLAQGSVAPTPESRRFQPKNIQSDGFTLGSSMVDLTGAAIPTSKVPDCTGTALKQPAGEPLVDGTKPCKPWAVFPPFEGLYLN